MSVCRQKDAVIKVIDYGCVMWMDSFSDTELSCILVWMSLSISKSDIMVLSEKGEKPSRGLE